MSRPPRPCCLQLSSLQLDIAGKSAIQRLLIPFGLALLLPLATSRAETPRSILQQPARPDSLGQIYSFQMQFEPNVGQVDEPVKFVSRGPGYTLFLTSTQAVLSMHPAEALRRLKHEKLARHTFQDDAGQPERPPATLRMTLVGAAQQPEITGESQLPGTVNYFLGNDQNKWHTAIPTFSKVQYRQVY